jgi:hypothetical protein
MSDEFVEEIHEVRRRIAEECDYDLEKIGEYFIELQKRFPERLVNKISQVEHDSIKAID